jgi:hypothetical protein
MAHVLIAYRLSDTSSNRTVLRYAVAMPEPSGTGVDGAVNTQFDKVENSARLCGFLRFRPLLRIPWIPLEMRRAHGVGFEPRRLAGGFGRVCTLVCMFACRKGAKRPIRRSHPFRAFPRSSAKNCRIRG